MYAVKILTSFLQTQDMSCISSQPIHVQGTRSYEPTCILNYTWSAVNNFTVYVQIVCAAIECIIISTTDYLWSIMHISLPGILGSLEVHDNWWGSSHEEPPLQADPGSQPVLPRPPETAAHWYSTPEQPSRDVGSTQLPPAHHIQVLQHIWAVVQRPLCHDRGKGMFYRLIM